MTEERKLYFKQWRENNREYHNELIKDSYYRRREAILLKKKEYYLKKKQEKLNQKLGVMPPQQ